MFWTTFLASGLATIVGVILGIPVGLTLHNWIERKRQRRFQLEIKKRERQLLQILKEALQENSRITTKILQDVNRIYSGPTNEEISDNVDISAIRSTTTFRYEVIKNLELNFNLDKLCVHLERAHFLLNLQLEQYHLRTHYPNHWSDIRKGILNTIRYEVNKLPREINTVISLIDDELGKYE